MCRNDKGVFLFPLCGWAETVPILDAQGLSEGPVDFLQEYTLLFLLSV